MQVEATGCLGKSRSFKQRVDDFLRAKKTSKRGEELRNRKRCKTDAISKDTIANSLTSLIDYSKLVKVSAPVSTGSSIFRNH